MDVVDFYDMFSNHILIQETKDAFKEWVETEAKQLEKYCDELDRFGRKFS